jgi:hypothetical protein
VGFLGSGRFGSGIVVSRNKDTGAWYVLFIGSTQLRSLLISAKLCLWSDSADAKSSVSVLTGRRRQLSGPSAVGSVVR